MNLGGWIIVALSCILLLGLIIYCYTRFLSVYRSDIEPSLERDTESKM